LSGVGDDEWIYQQIIGLETAHIANQIASIVKCPVYGLSPATQDKRNAG